MSELRQALRSLRRRPAVPLLVVGILALGLGGFIALWSAADAVVWRPLPYPDSARLVRIWGSGNGDSRSNVNPLDARDWAAQARSFSAVGVFNAGSATVRLGDAAEYLPVARVSAGFFRVLGVRPALGRFFVGREEVLGEHHVAVLAWETWQSRFGGDPGILGRSILIWDTPYTIVGVAPAGFQHPLPDQLAAAALYRPLAFDPAKVGRGGHWVTVIARLRPGVGVARAQAEMDAICRQLGRLNPAHADWGALVEPLHAAMTGGSRQPMLLVLGATCLLLLLACGNVAALLLARGSTRGGELAVRRALGATGVGLTRQLVIEMAVLGTSAAVVGTLVGAALLAGLRALGAGQIPLLDRATVDARALVAGLLATLVTIAVAGAAPIAHGVRTAAGARVTASRERRRLERSLVTAQLALCLTLLVGAALLLRSLEQLYAVDPGFRPQHAVTFGIYLSGDRYDGEAPVRAFFARLDERLARVPGVVAVGAVDNLPLGGGYNCNSIAAEGGQAVSDAEEPCAEQRTATPGYFTALGLQRIAGRTFVDADGPQAPPVVVVTESFARHHWPGRPAIGRRLKWGSATSDDPWRTVVGVVRDVHHFGLDAPTKPEVYLPEAQIADSGLQVVVRSTLPPAVLYPELRRAVAELDPTLPLAGLRPMDDLLADSTAQRRLRTWVMGSFALLAIALATAGLYGSLAHAVGARRRELSVRAAVGASRRQIVRLVLGEGMRLTLVGLLLGGAGALLAARGLRQVLFGVRPLDVPSFAASASLLATVALLAAWLPARRAAAVDPASALRQE